MSMIKRYIETHEFSERLAEDYQEAGLRPAITRHLLRTLPYRTEHIVQPFSSVDDADAGNQVLLLYELRMSIVTVAVQIFSDGFMADELLNERTIEVLVQDINALSYGETYIRDEYQYISTKHLSEPIFSDEAPNGSLIEATVPFLEYLSRHSCFSFWREWYQGFLDGKPLDWQLQRRVAELDDQIWEAGPEAVAEEIEQIRAEWLAGKALNAASSQPQPVTKSEKSAIAQRIAVNRDALAVSIAGVLEQLSGFKERVRGLNHLDPEFRADLLEFIDNLSEKLNALLHDLPAPGDELDDAATSRLVLWLREFKPLIRSEAAKYVSPQNVTEAAIPTAIILGCTGVGSMLGMPLAGAAVGGLITGQIKPGKAADVLTKPAKPDPDGT